MHAQKLAQPKSDDHAHKVIESRLEIITQEQHKLVEWRRNQLSSENNDNPNKINSTTSTTTTSHNAFNFPHKTADNNYMYSSQDDYISSDKNNNNNTNELAKSDNKIVYMNNTSITSPSLKAGVSPIKSPLKPVLTNRMGPRSSMHYQSWAGNLVYRRAPVNLPKYVNLPTCSQNFKLFLFLKNKLAKIKKEKNKIGKIK
jgi:hypothetical protein